MSIQVFEHPLAQGIRGIGSSLGSALEQQGQRAFEQRKLAQQRALSQQQKQEEREFIAGESALERAARLGLKKEEFQEKRALSEEERTRLVQSGTILESVLTPLGSNPSLPQLGNAYSSYIEQGGDPAVWKQAFEPYEPFLKEQARTQGAQSMLQKLFGGQPQGTTLGGALGEENILAQDQITTPQRTQTQGIDISTVPESELVTATGLPYPEIAKMAQTELQRRDLAQKRTESQRKYESEISTPFLKKVDESRDNVRQKEGALDLMEGALQEGDLTFFSRDNFANFLGQFGEGLRTAKGAQLLNAQKEFLLSNIQRAGARPNQWIEQQISNMLPKTGRNKEANLTVVEALRAETEIQRKKIQLTDEIAQNYRNQIGYVPANIGALVDAQMVPFAQEVQDRLAYRLRGLHESEMGAAKLTKLVGKKVPKGTPLTTSMAKNFVKKYGDVDSAIKNAEKLGYKITTKDEWQRWQR